MPPLLQTRLALVAKDPETLDAVHEYLTRFGARLTKVTGIDDARLGAPSLDAIVLFADDFSQEQVAKALHEVRFRLVVLVTARVEAYDALQARSDRTKRIVVLQRPAWGWMLLDALRALARDEVEGA